MHQNVMNLLLVVGTPSSCHQEKGYQKKRKKIMEEWKCYGVELKKSDDVSHASLDEISHSKKTDQNKEAGAQWAYWKNYQWQ